MAVVFVKLAMLNFVETQVALHYFILVLFSFGGMLQIIAAHYQLKGLALLPIRWQPWAGTLLGLGMISSACACFVATTPKMLRPGPAGFEISLLFVAGSLLALLTCRLTALLLRR